MSLRSAIHKHWENDSTLNGALSSSKFFTGNVPDPDDVPIPYAWMTDEVASRSYDSSNVVVEEFQVQIGIVSHRASEAVDIGEIVQHSMESATLSLTGTDKLLATYEGGHRLEEVEAGVHQFSVDYRMLVARDTNRIQS